MHRSRRAGWQRSALLAGLISLCGVLEACGPEQGRGESLGAELPVRPLRLEGLRTSAVATGNRVWSSEQEFTRFWQAHSSAPRPEIDFAERSVVAVFLGERPNAGYSVEIGRIFISDGVVVVHYTELLPNPERDYATMITYPYQAVEVSRLPGEVSFRGSRLERSD